MGQLSLEKGMVDIKIPLKEPLKMKNANQSVMIEHSHDIKK